MMIDYCSIGKRIKLTRIKQGVLQKDRYFQTAYEQY